MKTIKSPTETIAKKKHRCDFCNEPIKIGEKYMKSTHVVDNIYDWRTHKYCDKVANRLDMYGSESPEGVTMDDFMEIISEHHYSILTNRFANNEKEKLSEILSQLKYVSFYKKLMFVIRHYNKVDEIKQL